MSLRHCFAAAILTLSVAGVYPVAGQLNPQQQSPVAIAAKGVQDAEVGLKKAQADVQKVREKVKTQLKAKPEWATITTDLSKAESDVKSTQRAAILAIHNKPEYVELVKQREDSDKIRQSAGKTGSDDKVSDSDLAQANDTFIKASLRMKAMEKQGLADDQAYNDAKARVEGTNAKMAQLDAEVDEALKNDTDYQTLQMAVATAQQQVDTAKEQLTQARQQVAQQRLQEAQQRSGRTTTPRPR
jgi:hypothetical protein